MNTPNSATRSGEGDCSLLTVYQAETEEIAFHVSTYTLERSVMEGEVTPEAEGFEVEVLPEEEVLGVDDRLRDDDSERVEMAFG